RTGCPVSPIRTSERISTGISPRPRIISVLRQSASVELLTTSRLFVHLPGSFPALAGRRPFGPYDRRQTLTGNNVQANQGRFRKASVRRSIQSLDPPSTGRVTPVIQRALSEA